MSDTRPKSWTYRLILSDIYHSDAHSLRDKARIIANRVEQSLFFEQSWTFSLSDVVEGFRDVADNDGTVEDFDAVMDDFYDYADSVRLWVETR